MALSPLLNRYDNVLLDLDGCVWLGDECTPGAPEAVAQLRGAGKAVAFLTNDSRMMPEDYVRKLWALGVQAGLEEVVTAGSALQHVLAERPRSTQAYVIGSESVFRHVGDAGCRIVNHTDRATEADVVVVAGHDELNFAELRDATRALLNGAEMLAADMDPAFPDRDGMSPGTGAIAAALEYATGKTARSVGKPDPQMFQTTLERLPAGRALMIGDRIEADLKGAAAAGIDGAIVLTGIASRADAEAQSDPAPVAIAATLHELVVAG
jgi:glycerol 3-phosphatase-2